MVFLTYEFVFFAAIVFTTYYICGNNVIRTFVIILSGVGFLYLYGGYISVAVVAVLSAITFIAAKTNRRIMLDAAICACAGALIFFKYTSFILLSVIGWGLPQFSSQLQAASAAMLPTVIPLGISFFTFEFIHYLVDVRMGRPAIAKLTDFLCFGLFWPTMVAGPIKRYHQFVPALQQGVRGPTSTDLMQGLVRVATGLAKKWAADNLTGWILFFEPQLAQQPPMWRWLFLVAIAARILLDFSGYSDMAIGFARMLGIAVPENFNWPYLARSPIEFWQRWHISLSSWIRDYIYIPLGGNRLGVPRRIVNALAAMTICGLWHGPAWNFAVWGLYHGLGLTATTALTVAFPNVKPHFALQLAGWAATMIFVGFGWLLFFYPLGKAVAIAGLMFAQ